MLFCSEMEHACTWREENKNVRKLYGFQEHKTPFDMWRNFDTAFLALWEPGDKITN